MQGIHRDSAGGAIGHEGDRGSFSVSGSSFSDNATDEDGGAIYTVGGGTSLSVSDTSFNGNSADDGSGGAIRHGGDGASLAVSGSSFSNNAADGDGGAIFSVGDRAIRSVSNSSFSDNSALGFGGAIRVWDGRATFSHITAVDNSSGESGGGISSHEDTYSAILRNSILADNSGGDCVIDSELFESVNNIVKDGSCQGARTDPALGDWVAATNLTTGYFPLLEGSPAINAGIAAACAEVDQLGHARRRGAVCNIGAIEFRVSANHSDSDRDRDANCDCDAHGDAVRNCNTDPDRHCDSDCHRDANFHFNANPHARHRDRPGRHGIKSAADGTIAERFGGGSHWRVFG